MPQNNPITIDLNNDYSVYYEKANEFEKSYFSEIYKRAAEHVEEIIRFYNSNKTEKRNSQINDYNNIIAFVGGRGTGKTSSMLSFCESLISKELKVLYESNKLPEINKSQFFGLGVIDPSTLHDKDNLMEIVISKMFMKFRNVVENDKEDKCLNIESFKELKQNLLYRFQNVFNSLKSFTGNSSIYDKEALENLEELASGIGLQKSFKDLVNHYLKFMFAFCDNTEAEVNKVLLITIDDFDLNINNSYPMLEDMRRYLMIENVIVVVACKIEQLQAAVEEITLKEFSNSIKYGTGKLFESQVTISNNYLDKLIPQDRRLRLPNLSKLIESYKLRIKVIGDDEIEKLVAIVMRSKRNEENDEKGLAINELLEIIVTSKTGVLLNLRDSSDVLLLPNNIRSLVNYIKFFKGLSSSLESVERFETFIIEDVFRQIIDEQAGALSLEEVRNLVNRLDSIPDDKFNLTILKFLFTHEYLGEAYKRKDPIKIDKSGNYLNYSLGDLCYILNLAEENIDPLDSIKNKVIDAIRLLHSTRLSKRLKDANSPTMLDELYSGSIMCDQRTYLSNNRGDFEFDYLIIREEFAKNRITKDDVLWIFSFISFLGKRDSDYRSEGTVYWLKWDPRSNVGNYQHARFGFLDFLANSFFPMDLLFRADFIDQDYSKSDFYSNLESWGRANKDYAQIVFNLDYVNLLSSISNRLDYKEKKMGDYSGKLMQEIERVLRMSVRRFIDQNQGLKEYYTDFRTSFIKEHPVLKYWKNESNKERLDSLLNKIYESSQEIVKEKQDTTKLISESVKKLDEILKNIDSKTPRGIKRSITSLVSKFSDNGDVYTKLLNFKNNIDNEKDVLNNLSEMRQYLSNVNG